MVRQEPLICSLPFRAVSHLLPVTHSPSKVVSAPPTGKPLPFHSERSVPHPDSRPQKRIKRFHTGLTERKVASYSRTSSSRSFHLHILTTPHDQRSSGKHHIPVLRKSICKRFLPTVVNLWAEDMACPTAG